MPLPHAKQSASQVEKNRVMDKCMSILKKEHPGWSLAKRRAVSLERSGQSKQQRKK